MAIFGTVKINNRDLYNSHHEYNDFKIGDDRQLYCQGLFRNSAHESLRYDVISFFATIRRRYSWKLPPLHYAHL